jgi:hypothetical protein
MYVIPCVGNFTEEKSCVIMFEFPTGMWEPPTLNQALADQRGSRQP